MDIMIVEDRYVDMYNEYEVKMYRRVSIRPQRNSQLSLRIEEGRLLQI